MKTGAKAVGQRRVLNDEVVLRATIEGQALSLNGGTSRTIDRFVLSPGILRGFEPGGIGPRDIATKDTLGGNLYAVARFEAEFPVGLPEEYGISGALFYDVGNLWGLKGVTGGTS